MVPAVILTYKYTNPSGVPRAEERRHGLLREERTGVSEEAWAEIRATVSEILSAVEREGEPAVRRYSERFDGWSPPSFRVSPDDVFAAQDALSEELREHVAFAQAQVRGFAELQRSTLVDEERRPSPASGSGSASSRSTPSARTRRAGCIRSSPRRS